MTKRQMQAQTTKKVLFETAIALFNEKGFNEVTVEEIALRAGTAKGSFYTYFNTKSDIILEEFATIDNFYRKYERNLKRYTTASEKLIAFTRAQMRYIRDNVGCDMLKILYSKNLTEVSTDKILIDPERYINQLVEKVIAEGQASGEFRTDRTAFELSILFNRSHRAVFLDWGISDNAFDLVKTGVDYCKTFVLPSLIIDISR
ncbi:MAG: TetR/AcrR family transcriptional regulator [Spirochaetales bacterium]|uniref:TetR/AcrR family transcriptional regulator n=1 Tax=Candidatus Thalassospirochaeta sargassi TaxID=3119039 RepID=A0AAJ1MIY2_9SPIO|nr:TetR/AcrR family transcriptional regulator [Spirochaetales bacterium]